LVFLYVNAEKCFTFTTLAYKSTLSNQSVS
jgi:hypothetical protein